MVVDILQMSGLLRFESQAKRSITCWPTLKSNKALAVQSMIKLMQGSHEL